MSLATVLQEWGCTEVDPISLYEDMFKLGEGLIQKKNEYLLA